MAKRPNINSAIVHALPCNKAGFQLTKQQKETLKSVSELLLGIVIAAGAITITAMAPNALQVISSLSKITSKGYSKVQLRKKITRSIYYLKACVYIEIMPSGQEFTVKITQKGRKKTLRLQLDGLEIKRPKVWGGCWWIALADIPIEARIQADMFRQKMKELGFYPLQRTVWIYPYDPRDEVDFTAAYYSIDRYITVMRVDQLDPSDEKVLIKHFKNKRII